MSSERVLSGMRPTGLLHLGHYHGVLKNWLELQKEHECFFFVADWHVFTTHYADNVNLEDNVNDMVVDWLAAGLNPNLVTIFVQSKVPEHAKLHLLLSMITPLSWLERVPSYKDQQEKLKGKDLSTYGFLGYPLLQSADILLYKAGLVPVGEDQVAHVELTREIARRFNFIYGRGVDFEEKAEIAISKMGKKQSKLYNTYRKAFQEQGDDEAIAKATALLNSQQNITLSDKERLIGYLEGGGKIILPEPNSLLTKASKMPGLDGEKMSKSYDNTISLRDSSEAVEQKIKKMPTDPARIKLTDSGDPQICPVFQLHQVYSDGKRITWIEQGCSNATIGCLECKKPLIDSINNELSVMQDRAKEYQENPKLVQQIIFDGSKKAREIAKDTMDEISEVMGLNY
ncbi:Tryptophanyl-tRNA synthetase [hydrothermal vent metagenome]|uniref:tryptophan--tRNA ligase n=1 Tax=hydrothermal vent metagenome TaxID=652676 RepID=A0A1W1CJU1_9ZZZZ